MKITNLANLPEALYRVLSGDRYERRGDWSVTELISPPQIVQLRRRYYDQLTEDASDRVWMLVGEAIHAIIAWDKDPNTLQEEPLAMKLLGETVTGKPDSYEQKGLLVDYKVTSVWTVVNQGVRPDWVSQLNCYAVLFRENGFEVNKAQVIAILRDWSKPKAMREPSYPQSQVKVIDVPLWPEGEAVVHLTNMYNIHALAKALPDDALPSCSFEERWGRPTTFAVKSPKVKRAKRVLDTLAEAEMYIEREKLPKEWYVEERPGGYARCEAYCNVSHICPQLAREEVVE